MRWPRWRRRHCPRRWFQDSDGTFFRNAPLILGELRDAIGSRRFTVLDRELHQAWREGLIRVSTLPAGDVVVKPGRFRDVYPDKPGLWFLDDGEDWPS